MEEIPSFLQHYLQTKIIPKLESGKTPETTVRKLLELANRKRRPSNDLGALDDLLAQMNIKATPSIGDCVTIDTRTRLTWLNLPAGAVCQPESEELGIASSVDDVYRFNLPGMGVFEVSRDSLITLNATNEEYIGRMTVYHIYVPEAGHIRVALNTLKKIAKMVQIKHDIATGNEIKRKRWWWPF